MFQSSAVCLLLVAVASSAAADVNLEWKFKEGDVFYAENVTKTKQTMGPAGAAPAKVEKKTTAVAKYTVLKTTPEGTVLEMRFAGFKTDGKDLGAALGNAFANNLKDASFRITLNNSGQVSKFEGIDEYLKKIVGDNEEALKAARMGVEEMFTQGITQTFGFLPEKGISKGDKWKQTGKLPLPMFGTLKTETEYVYEGSGQKGEQITLTQQMTYEVPKVQEGTLFRIIKGDLKAEPGKGRIVFDAANGRLVRLESSHKFKGKFTVEAFGKEQTMNLEQESTVVTRILNENPLK